MIPVPNAVLEALAVTYDTTAAQLAHFGGGNESSDGVVYAYPDGGTRRLLKIMAIPGEDRRRGRLCLDERLRFMRFLGEGGAQIAYPRLSPQGQVYEMVEEEDHLWVAYSMDIAPGKGPKQDAWDPVLFRNWGQAIGQLHLLTQEYPSWRGAVDPETGETFLTWKEEWQGFYEWCQDEQVREKWVEIREQLEALPVTRDAFGFIHNDPHIWNLCADEERVTILDFDVANHHWFMTDIAIACQNILIFVSGGLGAPVRDRDKLVAFLGYFMEGYERENHLSVEWLSRLDLFISYRRILMFIVMYGWLSSQPEHHAAWKEMILTCPEVAGPSPLPSGKRGRG